MWYFQQIYWLCWVRETLTDENLKKLQIRRVTELYNLIVLSWSLNFKNVTRGLWIFLSASFPVKSLWELGAFSSPVVSSCCNREEIWVRQCAAWARATAGCQQTSPSPALPPAHTMVSHTPGLLCWERGKMSGGHAVKGGLTRAQCYSVFLQPNRWLVNITVILYRGIQKL